MHAQGSGRPLEDTAFIRARAYGTTFTVVLVLILAGFLGREAPGGTDGE